MKKWKLIAIIQQKKPKNKYYCSDHQRFMIHNDKWGSYCRECLKSNIIKFVIQTIIITIFIIFWVFIYKYFN